MNERKPTATLRVAVADDDADTREFLRELLARLGHEVVAAAADGRELVDRCRATRPDLVLADVRMPGLDGIAAAEEVNRERQVPFVLISAHQDAEVLGRTRAEHIMGFLTKPVRPADVVTTVTVAAQRFEQLRTAREEAAALRQALEDRKVVERAKGILMRRLRLEEPEAYRRLRKLASDTNRKVADVCQSVLKADEVFQALEDPSRS